MSTYAAGMYYASLLWHSFPRVWFLQPRRSVPKVRDNVTATHDPGAGKDHSLSLARCEA